MRLALMTGAAAALSLTTVAAAQAETVYVAEPGAVVAAPGYVATAPGYVYDVPSPFDTPRYMVADPAPGPAYVAEPSTAYVMVPRAVNPPLQIVPRRSYAAPAVVPQSSGIVTTGYSTENRCFIDLAGFERCY